MFIDYLKIALRNLKSRQLRSWLTILGIVIGVFLIISLVSLSEGVRTAIEKQLKMVGGDVIMVMPGEITDIMVAMMGGLKLSDDDLNAIEKARGVELVVPMPWKTEVVRYEGEKKTLLIVGYPQREQKFLQENLGWYLTEGRWPIPGRGEFIVGKIVPEDIFPGMKMGTHAFIRGKRLEVVGVLRSLGNRQDDSMIALDLSIFREITGIREGAQLAMAKIGPGFTSDQVVENIKQELEETRKRKRGEDVPPFTVMDMEKAGAMVGDIMLLIQVLILGLASIAVVVSGIGIMNTMYTSVRDRTKEIGIMKAVGAKQSTISNIFLVESAMMGLAGGIGGVTLGIGLAQLVEVYLQINPIFYLEASITPQLVIFGLVFALLVGSVSGFLPARQAAKLKPVDALRHE